jgi:acetylornithine deacetylase/succinyl-diaminopimelate desuccinylase-like protein
LGPEKILSDLIKINTVNPPGNEIEAAIYLKNLFEQAGVPGEIIETEKGRGNFIARMGSGSKSLLFLSHLDVVPAGDGWDFDPFSGEIRDGMVLGRGALDCKGLVAAEAFAFLRLAKEKTPLNGTLIFAATADEESGGNFGVKRLLQDFPEKLQADFAVNEGAEEPLTLHGKTIFFTQVGEKGTAWVRLTAKGVSCHGSIPTLGDNAVIKMVRALNALAENQPQVVLIPEVKFMIQKLSDIMGENIGVDEHNVDTVLDNFEDRSFAETLRAMTRMTVSPNEVQGGSKTNVVPDVCSSNIDIRILPGQDQHYVLEKLRRYIGEEISIEMPNYHHPTFSSSQTGHYEAIVRATREVAGEDVICLPCISTGATDSRFLREAGIPSYGIGHMAEGFDRELWNTVHGKNEQIEMASLQLKASFLEKLARQYLI